MNTCELKSGSIVRAKKAGVYVTSKKGSIYY